MPKVLASGVANAVGDAWPLVATFIGGIGAFVAGSNTVSNMTFAQFQYLVELFARRGHTGDCGTTLQQS